MSTAADTEARCRALRPRRRGPPQSDLRLGRRGCGAAQAGNGMCPMSDLACVILGQAASTAPNWVSLIAPTAALLSFPVSVLAYLKARATYRRAGIDIQAFYLSPTMLMTGFHFDKFQYIELRVFNRGLAVARITDIGLYRSRLDYDRKRSLHVDIVEGPELPCDIPPGTPLLIKVAVGDAKARIFTDREQYRLDRRLRLILHLGNNDNVRASGMPWRYRRYARYYHTRKRWRQAWWSIEDHFPRLQNRRPRP